MDETMNPLYILGWPLGYVMEWIYKLIRDNRSALA